MRFRSFALLWVGLCAVPAVPGQDRATLAALRGMHDPAARVAALLRFAEEHPGTDAASQASSSALEADLENFPGRTDEIHRLAAANVDGTPTGFERWVEESRVADLLASAGPSGADLPDAKTWAEEALRALTEESYRRQMTVMRAKYKLDAQSAKKAHSEFLGYRASFLAAAANVDLREKDLAGAERALTEAGRLNPLSSEVSSLRGQLALARGQDAAALQDFEQAEAEGDLKQPWRDEMVPLYKGAHVSTETGGDAGGDVQAGLDAQVDAVYAKLFPPLFTLQPRKLPAGGHTVLLELFTGSGCQPCAAPDLAVESLLKTYSRDDLAVLEYDENIPRPDPLANPDSVARAAGDGVETTPEAFLDGEELPVVGASRADVENVVVAFAQQIEDHAADASPVRLALTVSRGPKGAIAVKANVLLNPDPEALAALPKRTVVRFALVQDGIRYSGENGIRFHRMVVRAMTREPGPALSAANGSGAARTGFDPAAIARDQRLYLDAYEEGNDRFGPMRFLTKNLPLQADRLAVVAWLEDPVSHAVVQTVYAPVPEK